MRSLWLPAAALLALGVGAHAEDSTVPPADPNLRAACKADYEKFCANVPRGGGRIIQCLNAHKGEVTTACQEALLKATPHTASPPAQPAKGE